MTGPRLLSLHLSGFKTFSSPTYVEFSEGITAVVGANGSGKSNLVDALRWAIGEQSLRDLRSRRAQDVIFAGTQTCKPSGMAEVRITFGNETGWLPPETSEVELIRRMYRSAEGEYLINGQRVRLRDISDLARDGGLEAGGHTVVGQGMVDEVLSLRGADRRNFIASVAGVAPYESQRRDAIMRLKQTRENIATAQIVYGEMEPRLRLLKRQANLVQSAAAARLALESSLQVRYSLEWVRVTSQRQELSHSVDSAVQVETTLRSRIENVEEARSAAEARFNAIRNERQALRDTLLRAEYELRRTEEQHEGDLQTANRLSQEEEHLRHRLDTVSHETDDTTLLVNVQTNIELLQKEREDEQQNLTSNRSALQAEREAKSRIEAQRSPISRRVKESLSRQQSIANRISSLQHDLARIDQAESELCSSLPILRKLLHELRDSQAGSVEQVKTAEATYLKAQTDMAASLERVSSLRSSHAELLSKRETLERMKESMRAQRNDLMRLRPGDPSVITVSEAAHVPEDLTAAFAGAVGSIIDTPAAPRDDRNPGPRADGHPSGPWRASVLESLMSEGINVIGWLLDDVEIDGEHPAVCSMLSSVLMIESEVELEQAWQAVSSLPAETVAVPSLKLVGRTGTSRQAGMSDTAPVQARESVLRETRIASLESELAGVDGALEISKEEISTAAEELSAGLKQLQNAEHSVQQANVAVISARSNQQHFIERIRSVSAQLERDEIEAGRLSQSRRDLKSQLEAETAKQIELEETSSRDRALIDILDDECNRKAAEISTLEEAWRERSSAIRLIERTLEIEEQERERLRRLINQHELSRKQNCARLASTQAEVEAAKRLAQERASRLDQARLELQSAQSAYEMAPSDPAVDSAGTYVVDLSQLHQQLEEIVGRLERERSDLRHIDEALESLVRECEVDLHQHPSELPRVEQQRSDNEIDIRRLRIRAEQAQEIEPGTQEEYGRLLEARNTLGEQLEDLSTASDELEALLSYADREVHRRFRISFAQVNSLFQDFFKEIFGGGTGELMVESMDDVDAVEIVAQLPGKRARDLAGLSGGERTLVAGAFLFALLSAAPPPFCVLDEVDAALDESNVDRYVGVLKTLAARTQFVVVTHNRATMASANSLYGIFLDSETGSRALSIKLDQAIAS